MLKKKMLAFAMALAVMGGLLTGCGKDAGGGAQGEVNGGSQEGDDSQNQQGDTSQENTGQEGSGQESGGATESFTEKAPEEYEGTITLWAWDKASEDKVVAEFNKVYPNIKVDVISVGYADYVNKVQTGLVGGGELPDIIKAEYGFRAQMQAMDVYDYLDEAPYNLDTSLVMDYEIPCSSYNGHVVGIENSINTAGFAYKKDLAEQYLGTSDPDKLQEMLATWDDYVELGKKVYEESNGEVSLITAWGDMQDYLLNLGDEPLSEDGKATDYLLNQLPEKRYDLFQKMLAGNTFDKNIAQIYEPGYLSSYADDKHIFYLCSTWHSTAYIDGNDGENDGRWHIITPPDGPINLGGTNDGIWKDSPNKELAWQYLKWISLTEEGGETCIGARGYYIPYKPFIENHDWSQDLTTLYGDQNTAQLFAVDMAAKVKVRKPEFYYNEIKYSFETVERLLMQNPDMPLDEYKELVRQEFSNNCPDMTF